MKYQRFPARSTLLGWVRGVELRLLEALWDMDIDKQLSVLAAGQDGVVHIAQLYELGFSYEQIRWRVRRGRLHEIYRGVYAVGHRKLTARGRLRAALFAGGEQAFFSGWTAEQLRCGLRVDLSRIELTVPRRHTPPKRVPGLIFRRTTHEIDALEVDILNGFRTSTVARILVELSRRGRANQLERILTDAVHADVFDPDALEALIGRHEGQPGVGKLKRLADYYRPLPDRKSELERMFDAEHARRPEIPPCERNAQIGIWEIDCWWEQQRVALELDGRRFHAAQADFEKDRRKDTALQLMRVAPMRASYWMWVGDKEKVINDLLALLALGARQAS